MAWLCADVARPIVIEADGTGVRHPGTVAYCVSLTCELVLGLLRNFIRQLPQLRQHRKGIDRIPTSRRALTVNRPCFLFGERTIIFCDLLPPEVAIEEIDHRGDVKRVINALGALVYSSTTYMNVSQSRVAQTTLVRALHQV